MSRRLLTGKGYRHGSLSSFTTWNPADTDANLALSGGNLTLTTNNISYHSARSIASHSTGKFYSEATMTADPLGHAWYGGIANSTFAISSGGTSLGSDANSVGYSAPWTFANGSIINTGTNGMVAGDVIGLAVDLTNKRFWFLNYTLGGAGPGTWNDAGNNSTTNPTISASGIDMSTGMTGGGPWFAATSMQQSAVPAPAVITTNYGASAFTGTIPSGYTTW